MENSTPNSAAGAQGVTEAVAAPQAQAEPAQDLDTEFENLIKGKYKRSYDERVRDTVQRRLKGAKEAERAYETLRPVIESLAKQHGVDPQDAEALLSAINAQQEGTQQLQENAAKICDDWRRQEAALRAYYPDFDMEQQLQDPRFRALLRGGADVRSAFEVTHRAQILPAAMAYAAREAERRIARRMARISARPEENGMGSSAAARVSRDVSRLTRAEIDEVSRRVARGERVSFG